MNKEYPSVSIQGIEFAVDVNTGSLRQRDMDSNVILFRDMDYDRDSYSFYFDKSINNKSHYFSRPEDVVKVRLPSRMSLDPIGMSEMLEIPFDKIGKVTDFDVLVDAKYVASRLNGVLPVLRILDDEFLFDYSTRLFTYLDNPLKSFSSHELKTLPGKDNYVINYDREDKSPGYFLPNMHPLKYPQFEIIKDMQLDPVGRLRAEKIGVNEWKNQLIRFPPRPHHTASPVPAIEILRRYEKDREGLRLNMGLNEPGKKYTYKL